MPVTLDQVAVLLAYVVPGYVFLSVVGWFLPPRAQPVSQAVLLSIALSIPLTWAARETASRLTLPSDSLGLTTIAFAFAVAAAMIVGALRQQRLVRRVAYRLTSVSHPRIWLRLLDEHDHYLQVQVDTMHVFFGYAARSSNDPNSPMPDLLLKRAAVVDELGMRKDLPGTDGLFIPGSRIRWIQFLEPGEREMRESKTESARRRESRMSPRSVAGALRRIRQRRK
jgi:hypothetical protein